MLSFKRKKSFGLKEISTKEDYSTNFVYLYSWIAIKARQLSMQISAISTSPSKMKKKDLAWLPYVLDASGKLNECAILENG